MKPITYLLKLITLQLSSLIFHLFTTISMRKKMLLSYLATLMEDRYFYLNLYGRLSRENLIQNTSMAYIRIRTNRYTLQAASGHQIYHLDLACRLKSYYLNLRSNTYVIYKNYTFIISSNSSFSTFDKLLIKATIFLRFRNGRSP